MKFKSVIADLDKQRKSLVRKLERIEKAMAVLSGVSGSGSRTGVRKKPKFSRAARERIASAQRARWVKIKASLRR